MQNFNNEQMGAGLTPEMIAQLGQQFASMQTPSGGQFAGQQMAAQFMGQGGGFPDGSDPSRWAQQGGFGMGGQAVPPLEVRVEGMSFDYQFTEDDVRKVFSRYGNVLQVEIGRQGSSAQVVFSQMSECLSAWQDLNGKQLAGIHGASLKVDCPTFTGGAMAGTPSTAASNNNSWAGNAGANASQPNPTANGAVVSPYTYVQGQGVAAFASGSSQGKKYTCRLEIGIENEKEYRVGSKVIQVARKIWQNLPAFQDHGGKTRLRGKGVGGPHESEEPLALCISCRDATCFEQAVQFAEQQLVKIHQDYTKFCEERGYKVPQLKPVKAVSDHPHASAPWREPAFQEGDWSKAGSGTNNNMQAQHVKDLNANYNHGKRPDGLSVAEREIEKFIEDRNEARKTGDFAKADQIRDYLKAMGVVLMDEKGVRGNKLKGTQVTKWRYWNPNDPPEENQVGQTSPGFLGGK